MYLKPVVAIIWFAFSNCLRLWSPKQTMKQVTETMKKLVPTAARERMMIAVTVTVPEMGVKSKHVCEFLAM